jgi:hypothetical protein
MSKRPPPLRRIAASIAGSCFALAGLSALAEPFVDLGVSSTRVEADIATQPGATSTSSGLHIGAGVRRELANGGNIGVRVELDDIDSDLLIAVRALDYRYSLSERWAIGAFLGAARLDAATPAYGYYLGGGVQRKELVRGWDLSLDLRLGDKIARDNLLPDDPQGGRPDNFYDLSGISVYLSRRF